MQEYITCECTPLVDSLRVYSPVHLRSTELEAIYVGPSGAYAIANSSDSNCLKSLRETLITLCNTSRVCLYHRSSGRILSPDGEWSSPMSDQELLLAIYAHTLHGPMVLDTDRRVHIGRQIQAEDARNRGVYRNADGQWFLARNGGFYPMSKHNSSHILRLALFGGVWGLHRFALGKWCSALVYTLTGGLLGLGWLLDLMQLSTGSMRDKQRHLLAKPRPPRLLLVALGLVSSFAALCIYAIATGALSEAIGHQIQKTIQQTDPDQVSRILALLQQRLED